MRRTWRSFNRITKSRHARRMVPTTPNGRFEQGGMADGLSAGGQQPTDGHGAARQGLAQSGGASAAIVRGRRRRRRIEGDYGRRTMPNDARQKWNAPKSTPKSLVTLLFLRSRKYRTSPRIPMWSEKYPITPPPTFRPAALSVKKCWTPPGAVSIFDRISPRPIVTYGRTPAPFWPPAGTPMITFAIRSVTELAPKIPALPKKLGAYPKSASTPMTPAPIQPASTPTFTRPLPELLPKFAPTKGLM